MLLSGVVGCDVIVVAIVGEAVNRIDEEDVVVVVVAAAVGVGRDGFSMIRFVLLDGLGDRDTVVVVLLDDDTDVICCC